MLVCFQQGQRPNSLSAGVHQQGQCRLCVSVLLLSMQAVIVMSDGYTYTLAGETLGSARQALDIIYIPGILAFTTAPVSP